MEASSRRGHPFRHIVKVEGPELNCSSQAWEVTK